MRFPFPCCTRSNTPPPARDIRQKSSKIVVLVRYARHIGLRRTINSSFFVHFEAPKGPKKRPFRVSAPFSVKNKLLARLSAFLILMLFWRAKVEREARFSSKMSFSFDFCSFKISEIRIRSRFLSKSRLFARVFFQPKIAEFEPWAFFCLISSTLHNHTYYTYD